MATVPIGEPPLPQRIANARRESLSTEVSRGLLSYLLAGNIRRGQKIPSERRLAEALGVGRSIVREAIKSLTLLGIVEVHQGDGTYLKSAESELLTQSLQWGLLLGEKRMRDLVEARRCLEIILAELAAERRDEEDLLALEGLLDEMRAARGNPQRFVAADVAFHYRVAQAAHNESLAQIMAGVRSLLRVWISRVVEHADNFDPTIQEHEAILTAIRNNAPEVTRNAMRLHMERAYRRLEKTFPKQSEQHSVDETLPSS